MNIRSRHDPLRSMTAEPSPSQPPVNPLLNPSADSVPFIILCVRRTATAIEDRASGGEMTPMAGCRRLCSRALSLAGATCTGTNAASAPAIKKAALTSARRAISVTTAPGSSIAATSCNFSAALHRRRRATDVMTSMDLSSCGCPRASDGPYPALAGSQDGVYRRRTFETIPSHPNSRALRNSLSPPRRWPAEQDSAGAYDAVSCARKISIGSRRMSFTVELEKIEGDITLRRAGGTGLGAEAPRIRCDRRTARQRPRGQSGRSGRAWRSRPPGSTAVCQ